MVIPKLNLRDVRVTEGGTAVWENGAYAPGVAGISGVEDKDGAIRVKTCSGRYAFVHEGR